MVSVVWWQKIPPYLRLPEDGSGGVNVRGKHVKALSSTNLRRSRKATKSKGRQRICSNLGNGRDNGYRAATNKSEHKQRAPNCPHDRENASRRQVDYPQRPYKRHQSKNRPACKKRKQNSQEGATGTSYAADATASRRISSMSQRPVLITPCALEDNEGDMQAEYGLP